METQSKDESGYISRREWFRQSLATGAVLAGAAAFSGKALAQDPQALVNLEMPTRVLGATGQKIPILLMGGDQPFDPTHDKSLHRCYEVGVRYYDSSVAYTNGQGHKALGAFIQQVGRDKVWITSKGLMPLGKGNAGSYEKVLERFLPDLQTDHLDMYFMHGISEPNRLDPEYIEMGKRIKSRGLTRFFGFSCHEGNVVELMNHAAQIGSAGIDAIMFRYSFAQYGDLELNKAIDACHKAGIGLIAMKTQASVPGDVDAVKKFQSENFTLGQAKLKSVWADERITAAISSMTNLKLIDENAAAAKSPQPLAMSDFVQLQRYAAHTSGDRCLGCSQHCESRLAASPEIAKRLRYLMYAECYGQTDEARALYRQLMPLPAEGDWLDAAAQACPQRIDIRTRLKRADEILA